MKRGPITAYEPHRYVDELPETAFANFGVWIDSVSRGDPQPEALASTLGVDVARHPAWVFEDVSVGISKLKDPKSQAVAIRVIFGSAAERDVADLVADAGAEPGLPETFHDLKQRVLHRVDSGSFNDNDLAWIRQQAAVRVVDKDFLEMSPFDGDQGEAKELARRVVRGRRDHTCHQTGMTIPAGEPHLMIKEVMEGEFLTTRHGIVAAWFSAHTESPELAEMLKPAEPPLAAAA